MTRLKFLNTILDASVIRRYINFKKKIPSFIVHLKHDIVDPLNMKQFSAVHIKSMKIQKMHIKNQANKMALCCVVSILGFRTTSVLIRFIVFIFCVSI